MHLNVWLSYTLVVSAVAFAPGASVMLVSVNGLRHGDRGVAGTILGDLSANVLQMLAACLGLAAIISRYPTTLLVIRNAGALYLCMRGIVMLFNRVSAPLYDSGRQRSYPSFYFEGFLTSLSNPKAIVFFASLFPLFVDWASEITPQLTILMLTFLAVDATSLLVYAKLAERLSASLATSRRLKVMDNVAGTALLFAGAYLLRLHN